MSLRRKVLEKGAKDQGLRNRCRRNCWERQRKVPSSARVPNDLLLARSRGDKRKPSTVQAVHTFMHSETLPLLYDTSSTSPLQIIEARSSSADTSSDHAILSVNRLIGARLRTGTVTKTMTKFLAMCTTQHRTRHDDDVAAATRRSSRDSTASFDPNSAHPWRERITSIASVVQPSALQDWQSTDLFGNHGQVVSSFAILQSPVPMYYSPPAELEAFNSACSCDY